MAETRRDIGDFIREQRTLAELSVRRLADMAGVSNPYLSQIERGLRKPSAEILMQLAQALQVSAETMYVQAGMLDPTAEQPQLTLEHAIRSATELTEDQRKALLGVYRSFVAAPSSEPNRPQPPAPGPDDADPADQGDTPAAAADDAGSSADEADEDNPSGGAGADAARGR